MKRIATVLLLALLVGGLCASSADASPSRGANCAQCHSFSNQPPVANAGVDQTVNAGATVTLNGAGSTDSDDGIASYSWRQTPGATVTLTNANTVSARFTAPNVTAQTTLTFQLTVTDRLPQSSTDTIDVTIRPVSPTPTNQPPLANAGADTTATSGSRVALTGSGSDPDGNQITYAWTQTGGTTAVSLSGANTASASFTAPTVTTSTPLRFQLTVRDSGNLSATDTITVTVTPAAPGSTSLPPVADAGLDQAILPGTFVDLDGFYSSDPDNGIASYSWAQTGGPAVALSDPAAMNPVFQAPYAPGTLTFSLVVTDKGGLQSSDICTIVVLSAEGGAPPPPPAAVNQPPVANAGSDQTVRSSSTVRLSGSGSRDSDDGIASYRWRQTSGTSVSLSGATTASASFRAPSVSSRGATLTFELTVKDTAGLSSSDTVSIRVYQSSGEEEDD